MSTSHHIAGGAFQFSQHKWVTLKKKKSNYTIPILYILYDLDYFFTPIFTMDRFL